MVSVYLHIPFCTKKCPYCHFYVAPNRADLQTVFMEGLRNEWKQKAPLLAGRADSPRECEKSGLARISHTILREGVQDGASDLLSSGRKHCQNDKKSPEESKDDATDCADSPREREKSGLEIVSVYFGGGTPSLLKPEYLAEILSWMPLEKGCEISIEANPEESSRALFETFLGLGINRLSLGVQSFDDSSLQNLGRIHSAKKAKEAILNAHAAGFRNISIDLMYDLPWQTRASWQKTLDTLAELPINHLSLYNLTIEPHTSFYLKREQLAEAVPKSEESLALLEMGLSAFEKNGLKRYEISAFAKNNRVSIHNTGYWMGRPFLGLGPSAFSYWDKKRFRNIANLQRYRKKLLTGESPVDFEEELPAKEHLRELFVIRLRMLDGARDENLPKDTIEKLKKLAEMDLLQEDYGTWKLTPKGTLFYDTVAAEII